MTASWRTTTAGIIAIVISVLGAAQTLLDNDPKTNPDWPSLIAAFTAGAGLLNARDNKVTSEQAGAKTPAA